MRLLFIDLLGTTVPSRGSFPDVSSDDSLSDIFLQALVEVYSK